MKSSELIKRLQDYIEFDGIDHDLAINIGINGGGVYTFDVESAVPDDAGTMYLDADMSNVVKLNVWYDTWGKESIWHKIKCLFNPTL